MGLAQLLAAALVAASVGMLAPAFTALRWASSPPATRGSATEQALPAPSLPPSGPSRSGTSGWSQLAVTGALLGAAALRAGQRRKAAAEARRHGMASQVIFAGVQSSSGGLGAARSGEAEKTGRASKVAARWSPRGHTRTGKFARIRRYEMWIKYSENWAARAGRRRNCFRTAKQAVMKALRYKYRSRRLFRRDIRTHWIHRVRNNASLHGVSYSRFICRLKEANININRKILQQLGVYDRAVFSNVLQAAIPEWRYLKKKSDDWGKKKELSFEEIDEMAIPFLEQSYPNLYTDPKIRFNRKEHAHGVEYTVDVGDPEEWREYLPKTPELANFEIADHLLGNANMGLQNPPPKLFLRPFDEEKEPEYRKMMNKVRAQWAEEEEMVARGEKVVKKEGISRESWYDKEPQSWF